ncbi:MAG: AsmA family protein [Kiritimatiellae bacterium]|jgi:uncharacterized protein involved in outer membrane biogenesis|nr:AsmA family protein [Kiritimatiellia bacterium]
MKKVFKIIIGIVVVLVILLLGAILTLPLTIGPLVKSAAAVGGPKVLGVDVSIGDVKLKPIAGQLIISDLVVGNPEAYSSKDAFAVKTVDIDLKIMSLLKGDVIEIEKILIETPEISFETKNGKSNFDTIMANAQTAEKEEKAKDPKGTPDAKAQKKVVIDEFILNGSKVSYASALTFGKPITIPLPSMTLHDIGKASGGATMIEVINQVIASIVGGLKDAITKLATGSAGAFKGISKGSIEALGNATKGGTEAVGDISKKAADTAGNLTKGAADVAGDAADAAGDAVKGASDKLKGLFGK